MGSIKKIYKEEMRKWVTANIGEVFDKYRFVEVFKATYERSCVLKNAVEGFECSGIVPWNPEKVRTKKLILGELYEPPEDPPLIAADKSFNEPRPSTSNAENEVGWQVEREGKKKPEEKPNRDPMVISIGKKKFKLIEVEEEKSDKEKLDEIFAIPKAKKSTKMVGCRMPGLPHCVSSQAFRDKVKEIKDKKKEKQDAIEKRKAE